jgi:rhodanese-related sulfurtransferase
MLQRSNLRTVIDAAGILLLASTLAVLANGFRKDGIPLIARAPYDIYVPCPEQKKARVDSIGVDEVRANPDAYFLIDARAPEKYLKQHMGGSISAPYNFLYDVPDSVVSQAAHVKKKKIAVYGDGGDPDPGSLLALELAGKGIRNVCFIKGGVRP